MGEVAYPFFDFCYFYYFFFLAAYPSGLLSWPTRELEGHVVGQQGPRPLMDLLSAQAADVAAAAAAAAVVAVAVAAGWLVLVGTKATAGQRFGTGTVAKGQKGSVPLVASGSAKPASEWDPAGSALAVPPPAPWHYCSEPPIVYHSTATPLLVVVLAAVLD